MKVILFLNFDQAFIGYTLSTNIIYIKNIYIHVLMCFQGTKGRKVVKNIINLNIYIYKKI